MDDNIILFPAENDKTLIVKSNSLMEAKFHFKLWEMRIFEKMISLIKKGDTEFRACKIYMKDLIEYFDGNSHNDYELIKEAALSLGDKKLFIPYESSRGAKRWAKISIFPTVTIPDEAERDGENIYVELEFHNDLKPHLLDLKSRFKAYDMRNIQPLKSIYSIRIYILLKQFDAIGSRSIELETLRELLGIEKDQYPLYADFKKRVLLRPQQDLKEYCDIYFEFEEYKKGRKVDSIKFIIKKNESLQSTLKVSNYTSDDYLETVVIESANKTELSDSQNILYSEMAKWGVGLDTFIEYLSTRSEEHIRECIEITRESKAKNKAGYLLTLLQKNEVKNGKKVTQKEKEEKQRATQKNEQRLEQYEKEYRQLKNEKYIEQQTIIAALLSDKQLLEAAKEVALGKTGNGFDHNLSTEENYAKKRSFKMFVDNAILELKKSFFKPLEDKFELKEAELRKKYKKYITS